MSAEDFAEIVGASANDEAIVQNMKSHLETKNK